MSLDPTFDHKLRGKTMCCFDRDPTAAYCDRTMTREEWAKVHRKARIRAGQVEAYSDMESAGSTKGCTPLGHGAVLKIVDTYDEDPNTGRGGAGTEFLTALEEEEAWTHLDPSWRPWTVFLRDGVQIQEHCRPSAYFETYPAAPIPQRIVDEANLLGIGDISRDFNVGRVETDADRSVIFDWGCLRGGHRGAIARRINRRRSLATRLAHQAERNTYRQEV